MAARRFSRVHTMVASLFRRAAKSLSTTPRPISSDRPAPPLKGEDLAVLMVQPSDIISTKTFEASKNLPSLPIPTLEDTCCRYLRALEGLQEPDEHARTKRAVEEFLNGDGPRAQARLKSWAANKARWGLIHPPSTSLTG